MHLRKLALGGFACSAVALTFLASGAVAQPVNPVELKKTPTEAIPLNGKTDFSGLWRCMINCGNNTLLPYDELGMTPEGIRRYAISKAGVDNADPLIDTGLACHPLGLPRLAMYGNFEVLQKDDRIGIIGEWLGPPRMMYFEEEHRVGYYPTFMGDSILSWDEDTLVIDTTNINEETIVDSSGFPHSDQLHFIERWNISADGNTIVSSWTLMDPVMFTNAMQRDVVYQRKDSTLERARTIENVCLNIGEPAR